jgi:hypothetical protein
MARLLQEADAIGCSPNPKIEVEYDPARNSNSRLPRDVTIATRNARELVRVGGLGLEDWPAA